MRTKLQNFDIGLSLFFVFITLGGVLAVGTLGGYGSPYNLSAFVSQRSLPDAFM